MAFACRCCGLLRSLYLAPRARWIATSHSPPGRPLTLDNMNQNLRVMEYAVRGAVHNKAEAIRRRIEEVRVCCPCM